jgi:hypothetical protein
LITHAGVTANFWRSTLGAPISAEQAAAITINSLIGVDDGALFRAGTMLHGRRRARSAARVWAATEEAKHEFTVVAGGRIIGIDPGTRSRPRRPWHPWRSGLDGLRRCPGSAGRGPDSPRAPP